MNQQWLAHYDEDFPFDALAENLVNSHDVTLAEPEHLRTPEDLDGFLAAHRVPALRPATEADLAQVRRLRAEVRTIFEAKTATRASSLLNRLLRGADLVVQARAEGKAVRLEWGVARSPELEAVVRGAAALNLAFALERFGWGRLGVCEARPCQDVFVDTSKKGGRRFCGPTCASRTHVSRYRERHRSPG
jgi:predicted RNA-binding Zn ribbon-like protein